MKRETTMKVPDKIPGYGKVELFDSKTAASVEKRGSKVKTLGHAIEETGLRDGMTISFHHHLRNGDRVMETVLRKISEMGIRDLTLSASSLSRTHDHLLPFFQDGTITRVYSTGLRGELAKAVQTNNPLKAPVVFMTHGARARAIKSGELRIDVAFIAASCSDEEGNLSGRVGPSAFGSMGYPLVDSQYAKHCVAITDNLALHDEVAIAGSRIESVVQVPSIGDPALIATDSTRITNRPLDLLIAKKASEVLVASGLVREGFSFQAGSGAISLSVCRFLESYMLEKKIVGRFALGGITSPLVRLFEKGLFKRLYDVQTFGEGAVHSLLDHENHLEISADVYANPDNPDNLVNRLDVMILSATEIDLDFNVNSITGTNGKMIGSLGGAPDTAYGAKMTMVVAPSIRKRYPIVVDRVHTVCTPGSTVDVLVTEKGVAVHPDRPDIKEKLKMAGIQTISIEALHERITAATGKPVKPKMGDEIVGVVEYRDGSVLDVIYNLE